jgi:hypothetical protein
MKDKIIVLSCVHGRRKTVERCLELSPEVDRVFVYSEEYDSWVKDLGTSFRYKNEPLSEKWNYGLEQLKYIDFDAVIMMGSDDYFDERFLDFVRSNWRDYDMIGFIDMYFKDNQGVNFYWSGYKSNRVGEPAGAGKVYSKEYLERINYNLFPNPSNRGLDGQAWTVVNFTKARKFITSLKENKLWLCDIKDGDGITPLSSIKGLERCK